MGIDNADDPPHTQTWHERFWLLQLLQLLLLLWLLLLLLLLVHAAAAAAEQVRDKVYYLRRL